MRAVAENHRSVVDEQKGGRAEAECEEPRAVAAAVAAGPSAALGELGRNRRGQVERDEGSSALDDACRAGARVACRSTPPERRARARGVGGA